MLRNIFAFEDEDPDWQEVLSSFPSKVPRFDSKQEAIEFTKAHCTKSSNPDYPTLFHSVTTLIDWNQIEKHLLPKIQEYDSKYSKKPSVPDEESLQNNRYLNCEKEEDKILHEYVNGRLNLKIHQTLTYESRYNTLRYLFFHMKCGIYVMIRENALKIFAPFVNKDYHNTWGDKLKIDSADGSVEKYVEEKAAKLRHDPEKLLPMDQWWANGNIICNSYTSGKGESSNQIWGDHFLLQLKDMFSELCQSRTIPDCEFFINKRDYPQLKIDTQEVPKEPYGFIYGFNDLDEYDDIPLERHSYKSYMPILSFYLSKRFADIPFPTTEDWESATGKVYPASFNHHVDAKTREMEIEPPRDFFTQHNLAQFHCSWEQKVPTAFFRGGATGGGVTGKTNQRVRIAEIHHEWSKNPQYNGTNALINEGKPYLDAKITGWNMRDKKLPNQAMTFATPKDFPFNGTKKANFIPIYEQSRYKYILYIEGHCAACRYGFMMILGSVILKVDSRCVADKMWYFPLLKPYNTSKNGDVLDADHIPIKKDYSDLLEKLEWCHANDTKCAQIAANAKQFYEKYISKEGILDYLQCICVEIAKRWKSVPAFLLAPSPWTVESTPSTPSSTALMSKNKSRTSWIPQAINVSTIPPSYDLTKPYILKMKHDKFCAKAKGAYTPGSGSGSTGVLCSYCNAWLDLKAAQLDQQVKESRKITASETEKKKSFRSRMVKSGQDKSSLVSTEIAKIHKQFGTETVVAAGQEQQQHEHEGEDDGNEQDKKRMKVEHSGSSGSHKMEEDEDDEGDFGADER